MPEMSPTDGSDTNPAARALTLVPCDSLDDVNHVFGPTVRDKTAQRIEQSGLPLAMALKDVLASRRHAASKRTSRVLSAEIRCEPDPDDWE